MNLNDKRILVTGANGFVGKHLVQELYDHGSDVYTSNFTRDLRYRQSVEELYEVAQPHVVIHLAGTVGGVKDNIARPGEFFYDNLMMGMLMMDVGRHYNLRKFVQMGSACEYPRDAKTPLRESDIWNGFPEVTNGAYGIAKRALLMQGQAYRQQYGMPVIHLLPTNLYGPGDSFSESAHVISALIKKFVHAKANNLPSVEVWGTGRATRDFLYVKDAVRGILKAAAYYDSPEPVNLASGVEISISGLTRLIQTEVGYKGKVAWSVNSPEGQPKRLLDTGRARIEFGFDCDISIVEGIKETVNWYNEKLRSDT